MKMKMKMKIKMKTKRTEWNGKGRNGTERTERKGCVRGGVDGP